MEKGSGLFGGGFGDPSLPRKRVFLLPCLSVRYRQAVPSRTWFGKSAFIAVADLGGKGWELCHVPTAPQALGTAVQGPAISKYPATECINLVLVKPFLP